MNELTDIQKSYIARLMESSHAAEERLNSSLASLKEDGFVISEYDSKHISTGNRAGEVVGERGDTGDRVWVWDGSVWISMFRLREG